MNEFINNSDINTSADYWESVLFEKALLYNDLDKRLKWLLSEQKKNEVKRNNYKSEKLEYPELIGKGKEVLAELEAKKSPIKNERERDMITGVFSAKIVKFMYLSEAFVNVINHTKDRIFFRDNVEKVMINKKDEIEKIMFLIDCRNDYNLINDLKYWDFDDWKGVSNQLIKEVRTTEQTKNEFIKSDYKGSIPDKVWLLHEIGFLSLIKGWAAADQGRLLSILMGGHYNNYAMFISQQNNPNADKFRKDKQLKFARNVLKSLPPL